MKTKIRLLLLGLFLLTTSVFSQDPNFQIYLCFGQSNMEGQGTIENQDKTVDSRFQVMEAVSCSNLGRTMGSWSPATAPLCRCNTGLCPADYFGRTLVSSLPTNVKIGVINVSVAGCKIELFDKNNYQAYVATAPSWMVSIINEYGGNPYARLVQIAKLAQKDGVIKGILLHQGESNVGDNAWASKVKGVYNNLLTDLGLNAANVPLLAGEVVNADQGGVSAGANSMIDLLPNTIPTSYVISSSGVPAGSDHLHFTSAGYRELGKRYATKMISLLGTNIPVTGVSVSPTTVSINTGATSQLTATVSPSNATNKSVTWKSSNTTIASVSSTGLVTGVATGAATITVTTTDGAKTATCAATVNNVSPVAVTGVSVSPTTASINIGATSQLTATVSPSNATNKSVTWKSSNTAIATVSSTGLVTGVASGAAIITVTTLDGAKTATSSITVTPNSTTPCSNPVAITIPFKFDGAGEYCWSTTQAIAYVNSWNMDLVEINGVNYTNKWSSTMPTAINGSWYIHYKASVAWAHFEAPATKSASVTLSSKGIENNEVSLYPNPFNASLNLTISRPGLVNNVFIVDQMGRVISRLEKSQISSMNIIGGELPAGIYFIKVVSSDNANTYKVIKK